MKTSYEMVDDFRENLPDLSADEVIEILCDYIETKEVADSLEAFLKQELRNQLS